MKAILKRELIQYFGTFLAYGIAAAFCVISSLFLWAFEGQYNIINIGQASLVPFFTIAPLLLIFLIPALAMRAFAEEHQQGTFSWLMSKPVSLSQILVGKFLSMWIVVFFCLLGVIPFVHTLYYLSIPEGNIDFGVITSGCLGLMLVSGVLIAIGILSSAWAKNQIVAYLLGVCICFLMFQGLDGLASYKLFGSADYILQNIGLSYPYGNFVKGVVELKYVLYFVVLMLFFTYLAHSILNRKKRAA